jgi:flagellar hook assembly protein FlgD
LTQFRIGSLFRALSLAVVCLAWLAVSAHAQNIVTRFEVRESVISPGDDDKKEETHIVYTLQEAADSLSLVVFEADSVTMVYSFAAQTSSGTHEEIWNGTYTGGAPAPEGAYVVTLFVRDASSSDYLSSLPVFIDLTPPTVQILSVLPNPYAPGAPGSTTSMSISFVANNTSPVFPGRPPDELKNAFTNPDDDPFTPASLITTPPFTGTSGSYVMAWNGTVEPNALADGEYSVTLTINDVAGYTATSLYHFDVDTRSPEVKVTSLADGASVRVVPDELLGYSLDPSGVDSLLVSYATNRPLHPVDMTWLGGDTLYFSVPLADSFTTEGLHQLDFRSVDVFGRATSYTFSFRSDATAPLAPTLDPYLGGGKPWTGSVYPLSGTLNGASDAGAFVRVYRNGVVVDSVATLNSVLFDVDVPLVSGRNDLVAVVRDGAFNVGPPSNTVTVVFDTGAGLFAPAPFGPDDRFDVNARAPATGCTVRVFDLLGEIVVVLTDDAAQQFYSIAWNGRNGSGAEVKKGPLVAVVQIDYDDGSHDVFREVFLYDPHAP